MSKVPVSWKKQLIIIWIGQAFSLLSSSLAQFVVVWWIAIKGGSAVDLMLASMAAMLPHALCSPFAGALIDRWSRKTIMIIADLGVAVASLVLALLFLYGDVQPWQIILVLAVRSMGSAFHMPAMAASVPLLAPPEHLTRIAGINQSLFAVANIAAPALGAAAYAVMSMSAIMMLDVAGAVLASGSLLLVTIPQPPSAQNDVHGQGILAEVQFGYRALADKRGLLLLTLAAALRIFLYIPVGALFPLMMSGHFGGTAGQASVVEVLFSVGMLGAGMLLGVVGGANHRVALINSATVAMGAALVFMGALPPNGWMLFAVGSLVLGATVPLFSAPHTAMLQEHIHPGVQGRVMSLVGMIMTVATPLGLLVAGPAADVLGAPMWFVISGVLMALSGVLCFFIPSIMQADAKAPLVVPVAHEQDEQQQAS